MLPIMSDDTRLKCEMALLGAILINNEAFHEARHAGLDERDFADKRHATVWYGMWCMFQQDAPVINPMTLRDELASLERLDEAGGGMYLAKLAGAAVTIINAKQYVHALKAKAMAVRAA